MEARQSAAFVAANNPISSEVRLDILDLVGRYLFAVDNGETDELLSCFTHDGEVIYSTGEAYCGPEGLRAFAKKAIGGKECLGRMHINFPLFFQREQAAIVLTSYLSTAIWQIPEPPKSFGSLRMIEDTCVLADGQWRIRTRKITMWNSETVQNRRHCQV